MRAVIVLCVVALCACEKKKEEESAPKPPPQASKEDAEKFAEEALLVRDLLDERKKDIQHHGIPQKERWEMSGDDWDKIEKVGGSVPPSKGWVCTSTGGLPGGERQAPNPAEFDKAPWKHLGVKLTKPHVGRFCYRSENPVTYEGEEHHTSYVVVVEAALKGNEIDSWLCITAGPIPETNVWITDSVAPRDSRDECTTVPPSL